MTTAKTMDEPWGQIVARAWQDQAFKKRLLADPAAVLCEHAVEVPRGVQVQVVENTDQVCYLTLPKKPSAAELSEAELAQVAGGAAAIEWDSPRRASWSWS
jgi:hypothetical protein